MTPIRYGIAGAGWRAAFYLRAAALMPERFAVTAVYCRTPARALQVQRQYGVRTVDSLDALCSVGAPQFVVSCVSKANMTQTVMTLLSNGMPTLSETPFAVSIGALRELYAVQRRTDTPLGLAEQYMLYPTHCARHALLAQGVLGDVTSCMLSAAHEYHAMSLFRLYLGEENGHVQIQARTVKNPIVVAGDRGGPIAGGPLGEEVRILGQMSYEDGRLGLYDFSGTQYHSAIRSSHVRILGVRGEIFDDQVRYIDAQGRPQHSALDIHRDAMTGTIRAIDFEGQRIYQNPYRIDAPMDEDAIAVCGVLIRMAEALERGEGYYPLRHGFRDSYLACLLRGAAQEDGRIHSVAMDWDEADV